MKKILLFAALAVMLVSCDKNFTGLSMDDSYFEYTYNEKYTDYGENPFVKVSEEPVSTFAIDADGGSYANMRRFAHLGQKPPVAAVTL